MMFLGPSLGTLHADAAESATSQIAKSVSASVYSAKNVHDFLIACRMDPTECKDEVGSALLNKMQYDGKSNICLTKTDYSATVPQWLDAHPETATMTTEDGIYAALKALYPC